MSTREAFAKLAEEVELQNDGPAIARVRRIQLALCADVEALRSLPAALMALEPECRTAAEEVLGDLAPFKTVHPKQYFRERIRNLETSAHSLINEPRQRAGQIKALIAYVDNMTIAQSRKYMESEVIRDLREDLRSVTSAVEQVRNAPSGLLRMRDQLL